MKIGIDISQIVYGTGVSVYTKNLVEALLKIDKENEYVLFGGSLRQKVALKNIIDYYHATVCGNSRGVILPIPPTLADILWNRLHILPIEKLIGFVDVFHSSDWTQPPTKAAKVTTIHDLAVLRYPETFHPKIVAVHKKRLEWVKKECDLIIAVSEATKKDVVELLGIPPQKIKVIWEGVERDFKPQTQTAVEKIKKKYGIEGDYILAYGGPARKNLKRLMDACEGFKVFVVGQPYVANEDLPPLYFGASCLVYPSLYEGFGLPVLEAMACGCPVVTSNVSSMPEVAGEAAILVDPLNVKDIARGIKEALRNRKKLVQAGLRRARQFSWEKTAKETLKVYQQATLC
jgi:glycosyltransferase involved in cell wall biosynthesis